MALPWLAPNALAPELFRIHPVVRQLHELIQIQFLGVGFQHRAAACAELVRTQLLLIQTVEPIGEPLCKGATAVLLRILRNDGSQVFVPAEPGAKAVFPGCFTIIWAAP